VYPIRYVAQSSQAIRCLAPDTTTRTAQPEVVPPPCLSSFEMTRSAAFFDLDKTIIARSSSLAFSRPFYASGLINRRTVLRSGYAQFVYLAGGADHDQMERMRQYLQSMVAGWPVAQVREVVAETLHELIDPIVYDEAVTLIEEHRAQGRDIVIVSSSGYEVVEPIGQMLGADRVVATRMVIDDGKYTGEIDYYAYGPTKADAIRDLAAEHHYDLSTSYAYSDSQTDLPMLEVVGHPTAVNPDKELARIAAEREWPVLRFNRPVAMRRRRPSVPDLSHLSDLDTRQRAYAGASLAVVVGAAALVVVLTASRRRRAAA
jgi:HAD superfamily hydrolase (TIGR01490 family)